MKVGIRQLTCRPYRVAVGVVVLALSVLRLFQDLSLGVDDKIPVFVGVELVIDTDPVTVNVIGAGGIARLVVAAGTVDYLLFVAIEPGVFVAVGIGIGGSGVYGLLLDLDTQLDSPRPSSSAAYIAFGRAMGEMQGRVMDVHGASAQRSDPKVGEARMGRGPQGDAVRVNNYVRVVRGGAALKTSDTNSVDQGAYPYNVECFRVSSQGGSQDREKRRRSTFQENNRGGVGEGRRFGEISGRAFPGHFIERLDQDGDGRVSRSEFDGPKERFGFHDRNGDGYLSEDEAPQGPPMGRRPPPR
ncbi:MAG: hypothetical protein ABW168_25020 [Sedimenticola sp.]